MKLLLENWKRYLNEDLLIENYEQAQQSVFKRATKLVKGWSYDHDKQAYESIEKQAAIDSEKYWADDAVYSWEIGGKLILAAIKQLFIPNDINETQKRVALLWVYNQIVEQKYYTNLNSLLNNTFNFIARMYNKGQTSVSNEELESSYDPDTLEGMSDILSDYLSKIESMNIPFSDVPRSLIERFFQMNRFIRNGKRDLNAVNNFDELKELIEDARPRYQQWQEKQVDKDAEAGKEVLLDNNRWQIIVIHNKGAACQLGKGTDWCTAAPGLEYFKQYYKPNDPLFYILDKSDDARYQFHFGSKQFMDEWDSPLRPTSTIYKEIMEVLTDVVPPKYTKAWNFWTHQIEIDKEEED